MTSDGVRSWPATCCGWLLRHGETNGNAAGLIQGQTGGTGLSQRGREQVRAAAAALATAPVPPAAVVSSDLLRCVQTADMLGAALGLPVGLDAGLRERSFGELEGGSWSESSSCAAGVVAGRVVDPLVRPPGGESVADLARRVADALARAAGLARPVLVVTSGGPVRVATRTGPLWGMPWPAVPHATPLPVCARSVRAAEGQPAGRRCVGQPT